MWATHSGISSSLSSSIMLAHVDIQYVHDAIDIDIVNIVPKTKL